MNDAIVSGVLTEPKLDHIINNEEIYSATIICERLSGTKDEIPVLMPKYLLPTQSEVTIKGEFRSHNTEDRHLKLYLYAKNITYEKLETKITLEGYICKKPQMRLTPGGRKITDILLAVSRENVLDRSDYIPVVVWGKDAEAAEKFNIGEKIKIKGRIQSRKHKKGTAYEVSALAGCVESGKI